jgi:alkylated DNA repair protein alkB family protein 6
MAVTFAALKARLKAEKAGAAPSSPVPNKPSSSSSGPSSPPSASSRDPSPAGIALALTADRFGGCLLRGIDTVHYVPDCVTADVERAILAAVDSYTSRWVQLKARRLQQWGGTPGRDGLVDREPLPAWLEAVVDGLMAAGIFTEGLRPNHVLINEYMPGEGIHPHTDGLGYYPTVATLSLSSPAIMRYQPCGASTPVCAEVLLRPRSLVVTSGAAYTDFMHSLAPVDEEVVCGVAPCLNLAESLASPGDVISRDRRVSLTIRHVPDKNKAEAQTEESGSSGAGTGESGAMPATAAVADRDGQAGGGACGCDA